MRKPNPMNLKGPRKSKSSAGFNNLQSWLIPRRNVPFTCPWCNQSTCMCERLTQQRWWPKNLMETDETAPRSPIPDEAETKSEQHGTGGFCIWMYCRMCKVKLEIVSAGRMFMQLHQSSYRHTLLNKYQLYTKQSSYKVAGRVSISPSHPFIFVYMYNNSNEDANCCDTRALLKIQKVLSYYLRKILGCWLHWIYRHGEQGKDLYSPETAPHLQELMVHIRKPSSYTATKLSKQRITQS